jgi:hypothetical protein
MNLVNGRERGRGDMRSRVVAAPLLLRQGSCLVVPYRNRQSCDRRHITHVDALYERVGLGVS